MDKVRIITNPNAGQNKLQPAMETIVEKLRNVFQDVEVYETKEAGDAARYIKETAENVDLFVVAGGDGTVHEAVNALCPLKKRPVLAILPGGTSNDFSRAIGMNQDPLIAVDQLLKQDIHSIDVGKTNDQYFSNFWGIGLMTHVSENVDPDVKETFGRMSYYMSVAQNIGTHEPFELEVTSEDGHFEGEAAMLVVGNGSFTGGIRAFFPKSNIEDGLLDVLIIKETSIKTLWSILQSKVAKDFPENDEGVIYFQTGQLSVSAEPKQLIDCDGERNFYTPSEISVLPGHLQMIVGDIDKVIKPGF
jgi:YegS/Rv2252/BmrU family lipid kinase